MALQVDTWNGKVVTMEMDPVNACQLNTKHVSIKLLLESSVSPRLSLAAEPGDRSAELGLGSAWMQHKLRQLYRTDARAKQTCILFTVTFDLEAPTKLEHEASDPGPLYLMPSFPVSGLSLTL